MVDFTRMNGFSFERLVRALAFQVIGPGGDSLLCRAGWRPRFHVRRKDPGLRDEKVDRIFSNTV